MAWERSRVWRPAMFGGALPESASESVNPTPTVGQSSVQQDRAVHSAMTNPLTVVTGPPGSGKSQVVPEYGGGRRLPG